jgi:hypothetical protein
MQIIRGTTPSIIAHVNSNINLGEISNIWVYIYQEGRVVIDKGRSDVTINPDAKTIRVRLTQSETLSLKADVGALFQIRLIIGYTAYASLAVNIAIKEVYKGGSIH